MKQGPPTARERAEITRIINAIRGALDGMPEPEEITDEHPVCVRLLHHIRVEGEVIRADRTAERVRQNRERYKSNKTNT